MNKQLAVFLLLSLSNIHASAPAPQTSEAPQAIQGNVSILYDHIPYYLGIPSKIFVNKLQSIVDDQGNSITLPPSTVMVRVEAWSDTYEGYEKDVKDTENITEDEFEKLKQQKDWANHPLNLAIERVSYAQSTWDQEHPLLGKSRFPAYLPLALLETKDKTTFNFITRLGRDKKTQTKRYALVLTHKGFDAKSFAQSLDYVKGKFAYNKFLGTSDQESLTVLTA